MMLELHILQNFPPSNLNRDDNGAPKECEFGGFTRQRISSQCLKRSVRQSDHFRSMLENRLGLRTKRAPEQVAKALAQAGHDSGQATALANEFFNALYGLNEKGETDYLLYVGPEEIKRIIDLLSGRFDAAAGAAVQLSRLRAGGKKTKGDTSKKDEETADAEKAIKALADAYFKSYPKHVRAVDVALFGRMLASKPEHNIDAACQVAHAISVNSMRMEFDYFTAVDDLKKEDNAGAGMIGTVGFASSCFYRYAVVDLDQLSGNLGGDAATALEGAMAFAEAFVQARPSGKQNTFAAHTPPALIVAVVRSEGQPVSLANAFEEPVRPDKKNGLTAVAADKLSRHYADLRRMFSLEDQVSYLYLAGQLAALNEIGASPQSNFKDLLGFVKKHLSNQPVNA